MTRAESRGSGQRRSEGNGSPLTTVGRSRDLGHLSVEGRGRVEPEDTAGGQLVKLLESAELLLGDRGRGVADSRGIAQSMLGARQRQLET